MKYIAITQKTAEWFLSHSTYLTSLKNDIEKIISIKSIENGVIAIGPLRISAYNQVLSIWHNDYLTGTDYEDWGFVKINSPFGVFDRMEIVSETLERELYVINQRLQGLLLPDDRMIHRSLGNNCHTCLAGRGNIARHSSIGWYEDNIKTQNGNFHSIVCVGPSDEIGNIAIGNYLQEIRVIFPSLIEAANTTILISKSKPVLDVSILKEIKDYFSSENATKGENDFPVEDTPKLSRDISNHTKFSSIDWTYEQWISSESSLSDIQRHILESDIILKQPIRIIGAAGTGKSLLMQLLAIRRLKQAQISNTNVTILYLVHNSEMQNTVWNRFETLGATEFLIGDIPQILKITTLFEYCCNELKLEESTIIDKDAFQTKIYQKDIVNECLSEEFLTNPNVVDESDLLYKIKESKDLKDVFADLISNEIGIGIKGRDLSKDRKKYIDSERPLTRFHGVLSEFERGFVFDIFEKYYEKIFETDGVLDSDDIAITFLSNLRTPLWEMKRKTQGFDYIFVDETQLFNQNERQIFKFLHKRNSTHVPIVIALDEAQELRGSSIAGFGLLGIEDLKNQTLPEVHRCTPSILELAFFTISRTTDLFGPDFPDFTKNTTTLISNENSLAKFPRLVTRSESSSISKTILKEVRSLRKANIRQIAIIIHADRYWNEITEFFIKEDLPTVIAQKRGEFLSPDSPVVYISKPESIGGQEFGAVICVGLEYGIIPPLVNGHAGLSETLEQQSLREMYLAFTRAKYQLIIVNSKHSSPTAIIQQAVENELLIEDKV